MFKIYGITGMSKIEKNIENEIEELVQKRIDRTKKLMIGIVSFIFLLATLMPFYPNS